MIVVYQLSVELEHARMAEAANAAPAQIGYFHSGRLDAFEQALVGRHVHAQVGASEEHLEGVADGRRAELLPMNVAVGPAAGLRRGNDVLDHPGGAADVHMRTQRLIRERRLES